MTTPAEPSSAWRCARTWATPASVRDLAERTGLPQPYLEQILLSLKGVGLVRSKRGVGGGYVLARAPEAITLAEIVAAVDGPIVAGDFGQPHEDGACDHEGQCVLLGVWADVGNHMREHLLELHPGRHGRPGARRGPGQAHPQRLNAIRNPCVGN